jgi:hypothetical protein
MPITEHKTGKINFFLKNSLTSQWTNFPNFMGKIFFFPQKRHQIDCKLKKRRKKKKEKKLCQGLYHCAGAPKHPNITSTLIIYSPAAVNILAYSGKANTRIVNARIANSRIANSRIAIPCHLVLHNLLELAILEWTILVLDSGIGYSGIGYSGMG